MSEAGVVALVEALLGAGTVLVFVQVAVPRARPWAVVGESILRTVRSRRRALYVGVFLLVIVLNYLYLALGIDERCTAWVVARRGSGFAQLIHERIEGDAVARLQGAVAWVPLTWLFAYAYVVVFPCLVVVSMLVFDHLGHRRALAMVLLGYLWNFALVVPFYLLAPVRETFVYYQQEWLAGPTARLLLDDIRPALMQGYRTMSGVDNCFPSFHTSLAVTMGLAAWHAGRRFEWLMVLAASAIVVSTVYLGVHWLTDAAAGLVVGVAAYALARRLSRRWASPGAATGGAGT